MRPRASTRTSSASWPSSQDLQDAAGPGAQQGRSRQEGAPAGAGARAQCARLPFAATFMISALNGDGVADLKAHLAAACAARALALPGRRDLGCAVARDGGRDHAREDLRAPARRAALPGDGGDHVVAGAAQGGAHRADHLRRARQPEGHRAGQRRPHHQAALHGGAPGAVRHPGEARCTSSCSSRCARTGPTTPSATATWASRSPRIDVSSRKLRSSYPGPSRRPRPTNRASSLRLRNLSNLARKRFR